MSVPCNIHQNQQISAICTRKECDQQIAMCQRCMLQFHRVCADHIKFLDDIPKEIIQIEKEDVKINKIFEHLIQQLQVLQKQYQLHFKSIYECQATANIEKLNTLGSILRNQNIYTDRLQTGNTIICQNIETYMNLFQNRELSDQQRIEAQEWREQGRLHYNSNNLYKAIECYDRALSLNPYFEACWNFKGIFLNLLLGNALKELSKFQESIIFYDEALKINPNNEYYLNNKGLSLKKMGRFQDAIQCYNTALKINSKNTDLLNNKGIALYNLNALNESIQCYDACLNIVPNETYYFNNCYQISIIIAFPLQQLKQMLDYREIKQNIRSKGMSNQC